MRIGLIGYSGERPPVGGVAGGSAADPGDPPIPAVPPPPLTLTLEDGVAFRKAPYLAQGYNRFDVMCIGAAGGVGGFVMQHMYTYIMASSPPYALGLTIHRWRFGGGPGSGGVQRIKGRLALLPNQARVVIGQPGLNGPEHSFIETERPFSTSSPNESSFMPREVPEGQPGGASTFGGTVCRASGGMPGAPGGQGGVGGKGGTTVPGGGPGSVMWRPFSNEQPLSPKPGDGTWDGKIGAGGQGGPSRSYGAFWLGITDLTGYFLHPLLGAGGKGPMGLAGGPPGTLNSPYESYVYDPVNGDRIEGRTLSLPSVGGAAGGATTALLDGDTTPYGTRAPGGHPEGRVVIRLTYEVV